MKIDSHVYCFEPMDSKSGHPSIEEHIRWVQAAHAGHHQPAWRILDREGGPSRVLAPEGKSTLSSLPNLHFRVDRERGRVVWTYDGADYTKQFFPPNLRNLEFTPHSLIAEMDYAGVDLALLHTDPMLVRDSSFLSECVKRYPKRLLAMAPVDEWRIPDEPDAVIRELTNAIEDHRLHAVKFIPPHAYLAGPDPWDDGPYRPFWEAVADLDIPVFFTLGTGPGTEPAFDEQQGYLDELHILVRWMERYPDTICSLTHGFPWRTFLDGGRVELPGAIWEPFQNSNCHLEVCFPVRLGDLFDFPYREIWSTLEEMVERIGASKLLWGTDMPFQNRFCTYRQSRKWIEEYCEFLSSEDLAEIMGGTVARILDLNPSPG